MPDAGCAGVIGEGAPPVRPYSWSGRILVMGDFLLLATGGGLVWTRSLLSAHHVLSAVQCDMAVVLHKPGW